jgi:DNA helicase-2/ATP-dependent DNA helicase PcrA
MNYSIEQEKIINSTKKYIFVLAGAGSGKTFTIVERINKLLDSNVSVLDILCITFSKKATFSLKSRLKNNMLNVSTIHSFCYQNIKNDNINLLTKEDSIPFDKNEMLKIYKYKTSLKTGKKTKLIKRYEKYLIETHKIDFCDLLIAFLKESKNFYYKYIFVDEFQDINNLEYQVIKKISNKDTFLFCVGDPDQSIYAFKGSNSKIIYHYIKEFKSTVYLLTTNYRSVSNIIVSSNKVIKHNNRLLKKNMTSTNNIINKTKHLISLDIDEEAIKVVDIIKTLPNISEVCVLFRNHYQSYPLKKLLIEQDISFINKDSDTNQGVSLLSIHESKGLEFDYVFIIGATNNNHLRKCDKQIYLEEERRIFYVSITRAKKQLYLCYYQNEKRLKFIDEM